MREADAGDCYLAYLDAADRRHDSEYRALCSAVFRSALADLWCVPLGSIHSEYGKLAICSTRRAPRTSVEATNHAAAVAWIRGDGGTEPLRWEDVCDALGIDSASTRRVLFANLPDARPRAFQPQAVTA
jgi:hypothetical protein